MNPQFENITPPAPTKLKPTSTLSPKLWLFGGGLLLLLLVGGGLLLATSGNNPLPQMQRLSIRLESLQTIINQGNKNVIGRDLKKVQADAAILVIGDIANINIALSEAGLDKIPKEVAALESDQATLDTLADAQLNGQFDPAYKKALSQKIESTMALMREVNEKTKSSALKATLSDSYKNFGRILDNLSKLP